MRTREEWEDEGLEVKTLRTRMDGSCILQNNLTCKEDHRGNIMVHLALKGLCVHRVHKVGDALKKDEPFLVVLNNLRAANPNTTAT